MLRLAIAILVLLTPALHGHHVWIEPTEEGPLILRFGEGGEIEHSPGYLDNLSGLKAWTLGAEGGSKSLEVRSERDGFFVPQSNPDTAVAVQAAYSIYGKEKPVLPWFYARWHVSGKDAGHPGFTLDLVPLADAGHFRAVFRGEPLVQVEASLLRPGQTEEETVETGENGVVHLHFEEPGQYTLLLHHEEALAGYRAGKRYGLISHNASVTWRQGEL